MNMKVVFFLEALEYCDRLVIVMIENGKWCLLLWIQDIYSLHV